MTKEGVQGIEGKRGTQFNVEHLFTSQPACRITREGGGNKGGSVQGRGHEEGVPLRERGGGGIKGGGVHTYGKGRGRIAREGLQGRLCLARLQQHLHVLGLAVEVGRVHQIRPAPALRIGIAGY